MEAVLLLTAETIIFIGGFFYTFKRERLFGLYFALLFLYAIFGQIGYFYFSELSEILGAYFGDDAWYEATRLIILSLIFTLLIFILFWRKLIKRIPVGIKVQPTKNRLSGWIFVTLITGIILFESIFLSLNYSIIGWDTIQDEEFLTGNILVGIFVFLFKLMVAIIYVLYCTLRLNNSVFPRWVTRTLFLTSTILFLTVAFHMGNRTDPLALSIGIIVFELYRFRLNLRFALKLSIALILILVFLVFIEATRYKDGGLTLDPGAAIIMKDYFAPVHMLFAAAHFSYIDPIEVVVSNTSNSLVLIGYPYLQYTITEIFRPGIASRSAGFAFYIFTEGYLVLGSLGFLYNSIVVVLGLAVWRSLGLTRNQDFNLFVLGLMGCMLVNMVRGQSSYFIKYLYMFGVPGIILYASFVGLRVSAFFRWKLFKSS